MSPANLLLFDMFAKNKQKKPTQIYLQKTNLSLVDFILDFILCKNGLVHV